MIRLLTSILLLLGTTCVAAQGFQKEAKKQQKALEKEGWKILPGDKPMLEQLTSSLELRSRSNAARVLVSEGSASTSVFEAAMKGSKMTAQRNLAGLFASSVSSLVQSGQSAELEGFLSESVVRVSASLRSNTVMTIFREQGGNYEFKTVVSCTIRDFWNLLPEHDKEKLKTEFGFSDEALEITGG